MRKAISAVVLPDLFSAGLDPVLRAGLYFDCVYADSFAFLIKDIHPSEQDSELFEAKLELVSQLPRYKVLKELVDAGVILPCPLPERCLFEPFSTYDLSSTLIKKTAESLKAGASLATYFGLRHTMKAPSPGSIIIKDPADLSDTGAHLAIGFHLLSILRMLTVCSTHGATPLTNNEAHSGLLVELANSFPSVAKALGMEDSVSFISKQDALAIRILEETLPPVRVEKPADVLQLRQEMRDELLAFRAEVGKLSTLIASQPWEPGFQQEIERIVARDVKPAFHALRRRLQDPTKRMLSHLVADWKSIVTSAAIPVAALVLKGAPLPLSILAGLCSGMGIAALKSKVEEWSAKRNSALTFLVEASKKLED